MPEDSGWIKLHRSMLDGPIIQHAGLLQVWVYCLLRANWEPRRVMFPGCLVPIQLNRGEFVTGRNALHATLYPDNDKDNPVARTVWRWLEALETMECVTLRTVSNRCTVVTVNKYKTYQEVKEGQCPADVPPVSSPCPADVPPVSTDKELNNQRKKDSCSELPAATSKPKAERIRPDAPAETVLTLECSGMTACWHLTKPQVEVWQDLFPTLDVLLSCRKANEWMNNNPKKRKTAAGMAKYLFSWLERDQDAGRNQKTQPPESRIPTDEENARWNPYSATGLDD